MSNECYWICRHGETAHNVEGRIQGVLDSELTARGVVQARSLGHYIRSLGLSSSVHCVASPLGRTRATAAIVGEIAGVAPEYDLRLVELGRGVLEGKLKAELPLDEREHNERFAGDPWAYRVPDGETFTELRDRVDQALQDLRDSPRTQHIIITHGFVARMLVARLLGSDISGFRAPHETIHYVEITPTGPTYLPLKVGE